MDRAELQTHSYSKPRVAEAEMAKTPKSWSWELHENPGKSSHKFGVNSTSDPVEIWLAFSPDIEPLAN